MPLDLEPTSRDPSGVDCGICNIKKKRQLSRKQVKIRSLMLTFTTMVLVLYLIKKSIAILGLKEQELDVLKTLTASSLYKGVLF